MLLSETQHLLATAPTWVWIVGIFFILAVIFGERILWDFEVKFPFKEGVGRGEVELECGSKKGTRIEYFFELNPAYQNKPLEVFLNNKKIFTIPAEKNNSNRFKHKTHTALEKPTEGDDVIVKANSEEIFSGQLVLD